MSKNIKKKKKKEASMVYSITSVNNLERNADQQIFFTLPSQYKVEYCSPVPALASLNSCRNAVD
jgi:hypothetical protein